MQNTAIYPGTFDPITVGHIDIIKRALKIFDNLTIGVAKNSSKETLFNCDERAHLIKQHLKSEGLSEMVKVIIFKGLLVNFAKSQNCNVIIRGLRAVSDFEYEFQMFGINSKLEPEIQTIFLPALESTHFISSRLIKEASALNGNIDRFVCQDVAIALKNKKKTISKS